jgi:hypothetical protein
MQSASTKPVVGERMRRAKRQARTDVGELLLAELAERRIRLRELLCLVRNEVAQEMASATSERISCRRAAHARPEVPMRTASAN